MWIFLFACSAPVLNINLPIERVGPTFTYEVSTTTGSSLTVSVDGAEPKPYTSMSDLQLSHGPHDLSFVSTQGFRSTQADHHIDIDARGPVVEIDERSQAGSQGHTLPIFVRTNEPAASLTATFLDKEVRLHPGSTAQGDAYFRGLVGIPIRQEPGAHPLTLTATDALGNTSVSTQDITLTAVDWPITGKLPLSKKKASVPSEAIVRMRSERDPVYAEHLDTTSLTGPMQLPTTGRNTSAFGSFREYPDGKRSHHDAKDIANKPGTPIVAAAPGTVRIARLQAVHGNAVLLAHGHGVVSLYSHMRKLHVTEGAVVEAGALLGEMGTTGRSTGPHLHWGVVVDGVTVDPTQWLEPGLLTPSGSWTAISGRTLPQRSSPSSPE